jgi:hypothetical protein
MRGVFWGIGFVRLSARAPDLEHETFLCKTAMSVPSIAVPESWHKNAPDTLSLAPTRFFRDKMAGATGIEPVISYDTPIANVHFLSSFAMSADGACTLAGGLATVAANLENRGALACKACQGVW